mmetsp:Transcript_18745/g.28185  ORF Transcript_18745/g.28185 Transcript_18745/m.28185 type:complete len:142 (-) Transcript_18745:372-797(-)|eukprot:CAMPEP_0194765068 /NCGR_PEP_ID=MMETSP0323_2-20130528/24733_1 /TAXON_ID=2866 ORGANISM="Crypthecodinium cohnii, Strain Seligo" /NCGR_SAMPLE_ID=MMETSP0323_2 /ASSEMBLY_ACC=CAM_ASM_000346 /LENGTH=141 /DNA_ID=CAMNT_0039693657 /DNA_START=37 /DNA_END=462 /DNA_ORIENTATION=+
MALRLAALAFACLALLNVALGEKSCHADDPSCQEEFEETVALQTKVEAHDASKGNGWSGWMPNPEEYITCSCFHPRGTGVTGWCKMPGTQGKMWGCCGDLDGTLCNQCQCNGGGELSYGQYGLCMDNNIGCCGARDGTKCD